MLDLGEHGEVVGQGEDVPTFFEGCEKIQDLFEAKDHAIRRFPRRQMHIDERSRLG